MNFAWKILLILPYSNESLSCSDSPSYSMIRLASWENLWASPWLLSKALPFTLWFLALPSTDPTKHIFRNHICMASVADQSNPSFQCEEGNTNRTNFDIFFIVHALSLLFNSMPNTLPVSEDKLLACKCLCLQISKA